MKSRKPSKNSSGRTADLTSTAATPAAKKATVSPKRRWLGRIVLAVVIPLVVLGLIETGLRVAGLGYPTNFFLRTKISEEDYYVTNEKFGWRFFPPQLARTPLPLRMAAIKPTNEFRIFLFGESAAQGDPDPSFGMGRYLEVLLRQHYPGTDFNVVCVAMTAINSHAILPIARECAQHEGDAWILYVGNNEVLGPFGASTTFGPRAPNRSLVRFALALRKTRLGQLIDMLTSKSKNTGDVPLAWIGLNMFKENKLRFDNPLRERTIESFSGNLRDILGIAGAHHVPVLLSSVGSNLKDCAPFASLHSPGLVQDRLALWEKFYQEGTNSEGHGEFAAAINSYQRAAALDPAYAELQYRLGNCHLALSNNAEAMRDFQLSRDYDALAFRAETRVNEVISNAAVSGAAGVSFVDAQKTLAQKSPDGITGQELFYDHVHLDPTGNYIVARAFAAKLAEILPSGLTSHASKGDWASEDYCDQRLALSPWDNLRLWQMNFSRVSGPPFTDQLNDVPRARKYIAKLEQLKSAAGDEAVGPAREMYRNAVAASPQDVMLRQNIARLLQQVGDVAGAIEQQQRACELLPCYPEPQNKAGQLLVRAGKFTDATVYFSNALAIDKSFVPALNELGLINANEGRSTEAAASFSRAEKINPGYVETYFNSGFFEQSEGHLDAALAKYKIAAQIQPNGPAGSLARAVDAAAHHHKEEADDYFRTTLYMFPDFWQARALRWEWNLRPAEM